MFLAAASLAAVASLAVVAMVFSPLPSPYYAQYNVTKLHYQTAYHPAHAVYIYQEKQQFISRSILWRRYGAGLEGDSL